MPWLLLLPVLLCKILYHMGRCYYPCFIIWQMLLPFFNTVVVGKTLHYMFGLIITGVIAKWQDGTATFFVLKIGRCYCLVARWNSHIGIERWQMLLPGGRCYGHCLFM